MVRVAWLVVLASASAGAEQWADEPPPGPQRELPVQPRFGPVAGAQLAMTVRSNAAPAVGAWLGARARLAPHVTVALLGLWELETVFVPESLRINQPAGTRPVHGLHGLARFEVFSVSVFERLLVPELTVGVQGGVGRVFVGDVPETALRWGLFFGLTRLRPSGWWLPLFVELGQEASLARGEPVWRVAVAVGL